VKPVTVEIVTYAPTAFYHCQHCELVLGQSGLGERIHREQARDALPSDLREQFAAISDLVHQLRDRHGDTVRVRVVDAASIEGVWKSLRYRLRRYPAVVVDKEKLVAEDIASMRESAVRRINEIAGMNTRSTPAIGTDVVEIGRKP
jgi:hypothetical protein